jgi:hypothetical protein
LGKVVITPEEFAQHYPRLYHMAEAGSWQSISTHGLLSTTALLDLFGVDGVRRRAIESHHRPASVVIAHPEYGSAVIRDQIPMREAALKKCLRGCTPRQWYEFLNSRVFFWVAEQRVQTLLNARAYRARDHLVITVNTSNLLERHKLRVLLSPINSGSTIYKPVQRGRDTFMTWDAYPYQERRKLRGSANAVAELAVDYSVGDITNFIERVERRRGTRILEVLV